MTLSIHNRFLLCSIWNNTEKNAQADVRQIHPIPLKGGDFMKAVVHDTCIGCGLCESLCPDVFQMTDNGRAQAIGEIPPEAEQSATEARDECPVSAIDIN